MFDLIVHFITTYAIAFYLITTLQWYNYKINRIIFHFHNYRWHIFYLIIPLITYIFAYKYFWIYLFFGYLPALIFWFRKINKPLNFTKRVKRFLLIVGFTETLNLLVMNKYHNNPGLSLIVVLSLALLISYLIEEFLFFMYKKKAKKKLEKINPKIITITGSYGKTSIKNFVYQLLKDDFKAYKTPRSVNTIKGIILDINTSLPEDTEIYITEAGARERGDIKTIVKFLENHYAILGKIGPQHLEYFKTIENIEKTKLEVFESNNLIKGFSYDIPYRENVIKIKDKIHNIKATLEKLEWDLEINGELHHFECNILGEFNAINISLAIYQALEFLDIETIKEKVLKLEPIPHRLQKIEVGGKIIIDDSFNGNIEGMLKSFKLIKTHPGRKIIVTPGIIEGNENLNIKLAKAINKTFDLAIITGQINKKTLCDNITIEKIVLKDKKNLEKILADVTGSGDLIIFSNDAPEYL
ncbi:Mur ligase family protein [Caminibacter mediatlanticus]|uniref:D-ALANYL-D-ALANINE-ADDING ENZYME n=1 Tax=Caminibacter mediatlanticus TB-2 TaxID=391592 RepID=A0AAI9AHX4_9BACT|nr:UDP-N-acetylmuramoyl-tripeptide--D-alanyl-D-alanine ligase [Caminibacter mediatlanticus]EDM23819.1 D-ALANYL-D-ALANINE-ADDING ENZYME [Caminibacter mediatlanticus TB-2]